MTFELERLECVPASQRSALLRATGRWWAQRPRVLPEPFLVVGDERFPILAGFRALRPVAAPDSAPWQGAWAVPLGLTLDLEELALEIAGEERFPLGVPSARVAELEREVADGRRRVRQLTQDLARTRDALTRRAEEAERRANVARAEAQAMARAAQDWTEAERRRAQQALSTVRAEVGGAGGRR